MVGIYKITNKINGKAYIGQSTCIKRRFENHKSLNEAKWPGQSHYNYPLYRAMRKYGVENFSFEVLEECEEKELSKREKYYINLYGTFGVKGYNQTDSTVNPLLDSKIMEKAIKNMTEHHRSVAHREKQRKITKALWTKKEYRERIVNANKGNAKISEASKRAWARPEYRRVRTEQIRKMVNTEEFRSNKSKEIKAAWERGCYDRAQTKAASEKHREKMKNDEAYRKRCVEQMKKNRPNKKAIQMLDKDTKEVVRTFDKMMDAAAWIRENTDFKKADYATIRNVAKAGKHRSAYGYSWELIEDKAL